MAHDRSAGFLQPNERAFLEEAELYRFPGDIDANSGGRKARSRIQNEIATTRGMQWHLLGFLTDLNAVRMLQRSDRDTWKEWESSTLPRVQDELEWLRDTIDQMIEVAENEGTSTAKQGVEEALTPLYVGDHHPTEVYGDGSVDGQSPPQQLRELSEEELEHRFEALRTRTDGLDALLRHEELAEILRYISERGECRLPKKQIGGDGEYWSKIASEHLVPGLAEKVEYSQEHREYSTTDHGEAVLDAWDALTEVEIVNRMASANPDSTNRERIQTAVELYCSPLWPWWDGQE